VIPTDTFSARLRERAVRLETGELLISTFDGSGQEDDLTEPTNCSGSGRIRHFHRSTSPGWPANCLPIDPARAFLGLAPTHSIRAQVFQNAVCNWRCWYCYVPFNMLAGDERRSTWVTPRQLVDAYLDVVDRPPMIDLSGGQPDLVPEWVPWTISALIDAGVSDQVYLWSDDNLSNDYFFKYLSKDTRAMVANHEGYGRVCCFKGFDEQSFAFNTKAAPELFERQFDLFARLLAAGLDLYAYATFTAPTAQRVPELISEFVDRLQRISESLPLRLIPLEIAEYGPVAPRMKDVHRMSLQIQQQAIEAWVSELEQRFAPQDRMIPITQVSLGGPR
jgi:uncharacterized Fe-S cluster-containing radical SAM superfamily protein